MKFGVSFVAIALSATTVESAMRGVRSLAGDGGDSNPHRALMMNSGGDGGDGGDVPTKDGCESTLILNLCLIKFLLMGTNTHIF